MYNFIAFYSKMIMQNAGKIFVDNLWQ